MVAHQDRFSIPDVEEDIAVIKEIVGKEFFDKHFIRDILISIKKEVLDNRDLRKELTNKLIEVFGIEGIKKYCVHHKIGNIRELTGSLR